MYSCTFVNSFMFKEVSYSARHKSDMMLKSGHNYVLYLQKGSAAITAGDEVFRLEPGDILHIPRGSRYSTEFWGSPEILFGSYAYLNCPGLEIHNYKIQKVHRTEKIDRLIRLVSESSGVKSIGHFYLFLGEMAENMIPSCVDKKDALLRTAMQYIRQNPQARTPDVAKQCGVSEAGLYNLFREYTDTTPGDYRMNVKLEKAHNYLVSTDITIEEISDICGFSSSSYFRKKFTASYGKTPREIRKSL